MFRNGRYANESTNSVVAHRVRCRRAARVLGDMVRLSRAGRSMVCGVACARGGAGSQGRTLGKLGQKGVRYIRPTSFFGLSGRQSPYVPLGPLFNLPLFG